jgi:long-chain acyl-CoA synthetase
VAFDAKYTDLTRLVDAAFQGHATRQLFGSEPTPGTWTYVTYAEVRALAGRYEEFLASRDVTSGHIVAVVSANRPEWLAAAVAAHRLGATVVPMYEVQQEKEWRYILRDARAKVCLVSTEDIRARIDAMRSDLPDLQTVARFGEVDGEAAGKGPPPSVAPARSPDDLAFVIYTSGTTGDPKGVELTHGAIASVVCGLHEAIPFEAGGRSVSILPWAHVGGLVELFASVHAGTTIAIAAAADRIVPAIQATRPTRLVGVPRVWNKLYDGITKAMASRSGPVRAIFEGGIRAAIAKRSGESASLVDRIALVIAQLVVFPKVRARLGGELRYAISGAAALSVDVARFIDALGIELLEVYGLTEVSALATVNRPGESRLGTVGRPLPGVELKIDGDGDGSGAGEVLIRTGGAMRGYRGLDEETRSVIAPGGWIRSGDLGSIDEDGYLRIRGRVREVYKLENGKFVSPAPIEEKITTSPYIAQTMVHGLDKPFNVALVVIDAAAVRVWCAAQGLGELDAEQACKSDQVRALVTEEVRALTAEFKAYEAVTRIHLVAEELSLANDMLTPSLKVKRRRVLERWGRDLEALYGHN